MNQALIALFKDARHYLAYSEEDYINTNYICLALRRAFTYNSDKHTRETMEKAINMVHKKIAPYQTVSHWMFNQPSFDGDASTDTVQRMRHKLLGSIIIKLEEQ